MVDNNNNDLIVLFRGKPTTPNRIKECLARLLHITYIPIHYTETSVGHTLPHKKEFDPSPTCNPYYLIRLCSSDEGVLGLKNYNTAVLACPA